ncbi:Myb-like DNA-binding domain protein [Lobosporangium transversale]|uniref:Homeodomain-like protein n=1 Tax=Lobosporangium transversale TaxID=64571 RepID=A0A1Y2GMG9_9FUNG|nr:hypothetical protein BCR41DRAFT_355152 [Lobosporangium transversale]KAF9912244.1 Myb-like DNA-binding domain protein [Lobosporangium transversale]ORZ13908.1 hypothetical protein BCR41DRAFT_355152 [Lobosporangium transversale]|eukprot:XP_021880692.1 hypothetical protein BCR41DRAFT_355152 [Lobosporangium transversale]
MMRSTGLQRLHSLAISTFKDSARVLLDSHFKSASFSKILLRPIAFKWNSGNHVPMIRQHQFSNVPTSPSSLSAEGNTKAKIVLNPDSPASENAKVASTPKRAARKGKKSDRYSTLAGRWTAGEDAVILELLKQKASMPVFFQRFPDRTTDAIHCRTSILRRRTKTNENETDSVTAVGHSDSEEDYSDPDLDFKRGVPIPVSWTEEEDQMLCDRVRLFTDKRGNIRWADVVNKLINGRRIDRTTASCRRRWEVLNPSSNTKLGFWSIEESNRLIAAVNKQLGHSPKSPNFKMDSNISLVNWQSVAKEVKSRTDMQCRNRMYKTLMNLQEGPWAEEENMAFHEGIARYGLDWKKIAELVVTRSPYQVMRKYHINLRSQERKQRHQEFIHQK